jgi:phage-related protein
VRGEKPISIASGFRIKNPTLHDANPLIDVVGSGTISINSVSVTVNVSGETIIDCDTQEAYYGSTSRNSNITLNNGEFPKLTPGENTITYSGFTSVKITPRWWTI